MQANKAELLVQSEFIPPATVEAILMAISVRKANCGLRCEPHGRDEHGCGLEKRQRAGAVQDACACAGAIGDATRLEARWRFCLAAAHTE